MPTKHTLRSFLKFCAAALVAVAFAVMLIGQTWLLTPTAAALLFRVSMTIVFVGWFGWVLYMVHQEIYNE